MKKMACYPVQITGGTVVEFRGEADTEHQAHTDAAAAILDMMKMLDGHRQKALENAADALERELPSITLATST